MSQLSDILQFGWKYLPAQVSARFGQDPLAQDERTLFVTAKDSDDWILAAKCRKLSAHFSGTTEIVYTNDFRNLPKAGFYFFAHYKYLAKAIRYNPHILNSRKALLFTHPTINRTYTFRHIAWIVKQADVAICLNNDIAQELHEYGVPKERILVQHMAADPAMFQPHPRNNGKIGFCMAYYPRKNPELVLQLVKGMPEHEFILIGRHWDRYEHFAELSAQENFTYYDNIDYGEYPKLYAQMDVFVSTSFLEGGPVPILEAMLSNIICVASRTGFCPDIIEHGRNGYLFDPEKDSATHVIELIKQAFENKTDVRCYVEDFTWERFAGEIEERLREKS